MPSRAVCQRFTIGDHNRSMERIDLTVRIVSIDHPAWGQRLNEFAERFTTQLAGREVTARGRRRWAALRCGQIIGLAELDLDLAGRRWLFVDPNHHRIGVEDLLNQAIDDSRDAIEQGQRCKLRSGSPSPHELVERSPKQFAIPCHRP